MKRSPLRPVSVKARARRKDEAEFRRIVQARDSWRCQFAAYAYDHGMTTTAACSGPYEVHHIAPRSIAPHLTLDPSNGVVLCSTHHAWVGAHPKEAHAIGLHRYSWEAS